MLNKISCEPGPGVASLPVTPHFTGIKARQRATWSSGNFALIGSTLQIVGETLCEAMDLRAGQRVLDVAAGNGNAALAAARRFCRVTASDYVPALLENAAARAAADGLELACQIGDAEALPFEDGSFDAVTSTFGAMFTPDHERPAREMLRVCRKDGKIGLANWTPDGFIGELFRVISRHVPPPPGLASPALWGTAAHLKALFGRQARVGVEQKDFVFRYRSAAHWIEIFRTYYGPVLRAFEALPPASQNTLEEEITALIGRFNRASDGTMVVPSCYLEAVIVKR
jgi:ubiquinone/menaquinone biosynthesis C-methylase UbiE